MRPDGRRGRGWDERGSAGFSLIELLVVVFILGVLATIMTINVGATLKKQRLETAARQLDSFLKNAQAGAAERSRGSFVVIGTVPDAEQRRTVWLVSDTNQNDTLDFNPANPMAGPDMPVPGARMFLTPDIAVAPAPAIPGGFNEWTVIAGNYVLLCDPRGYPFRPTVGAIAATQITTVVRISLTHQEMLDGTLHPRFRYDITVRPLWTVAIDRVGY